MNAPRLLTVGSINMDFVARVPRIPLAGETVGASGFARIPGGKGANQAVAVARLGACSLLCGRVGDDADGRALLASLAVEGVDTSAVIVTPDAPTGIALITVSDDGENAITVVSGANGLVDGKDVHALEETMRSADCVLVQLEIPQDAVCALLEIACDCGVPVILDPAPVPLGGLRRDLWRVAVMTPNQVEASQLTGLSVLDVEGATLAAERLRERGAARVVVKMGASGAVGIDEEGEARFCPAFRVEAVDTTAAGDAFNAALGVALSEGRDFHAAVRFACAAGALAASAAGAQPGMPRREAVERLFLSMETRRI